MNKEGGNVSALRDVEEYECSYSHLVILSLLIIRIFIHKYCILPIFPISFLCITFFIVRAFCTPQFKDNEYAYVRMLIPFLIRPKVYGRQSVRSSSS